MLAPTPLDVALGTQGLTTMVRSFMDAGAGARVLTSQFQAGRPLPVTYGVSGPIATWDQVTGRRHLAGFAGASSPHTQVAGVGVEMRSSSCAWIKLYKDIPGVALFDERAPGMVTPDGQAVIRLALEDLANMLGDTKERSAGLVLSTGKLTASAANFPGTQVTFDLDFGAALNLAFTRSAAWATSSTKIISKDAVEKIKKAFREGCGTEAGRVIFNGTVEQALLQNTEFQELVKYVAGPAIVQGAGAVAGQVMSQFRPAGLDWLISTGTFKPQGGSVTPFFPDTTIAVLPQNVGNTLGWASGRGVVPSGPIFLAAESAASGLRLADSAGAYAYAEIRGDGPSVRVYAGEVFLPVLLNPLELMYGAA